MMQKNTLNIIQISDTHLFSDPEQELLGVKTRESFQAVLKLLQQEQALNYVIHSGDMSQDQSPESYLYLAEALKQLQIPVYYVPGNHDDPAIIKQIYPCENIKNDKQILWETWQIILLNSRKPDSIGGCLDASQLLYLEECLKAYPNHFTIFFFHHHPILVGSEWLDKIGISNRENWWKIINQYAGVKAVFFGHVHQEYYQLVDHISCYAAPSTCIQFKANQTAFSLEKVAPGYRWIRLYKDGNFETGVKRVNRYIGNFNEQARGY